MVIKKKILSRSLFSRFEKTIMPDSNMDQSAGCFFTGLNNHQGTKIGFELSNINYNVKLEEIQSEDIPKDIFQTCYNWKDIMHIIINCLEQYDDEDNFIKNVNYNINVWIRKYEGWGMCYALLQIDLQIFLMDIYALMIIINEQKNIQKTNRELFDDLKNFYNNEIQALPFSNVVPKFETKLINIVTGPKEHERTKILTLMFISNNRKVIANFMLEKKRLKRTLVEHAAEVIGKMVHHTTELEIPKSLEQVVKTKIIDAEWVSSYWSAKVKKNSK